MFEKEPWDEDLNEQIKALERENNWPGIVRLLEARCQPDGDLWNDGAAMNTLGFAYTQLQQLEKAEKAYLRWIEIEPDRAQPFYSLGYVYHLRENWEEAIRWYRQALRLFPDYLVCLYRIGYAYYAFRKSYKAKNALIRAKRVYEISVDEKFLRRNRKTYVRVLFLLGRVHLVLKQPEEAERLFRTVIELDEKDYVKPEFKRYELAKALTARGEYRQALKIAQTALNPRFPQPYVLDFMGRVHHRMGEYRQAIQMYNRALSIRRLDYIYMNRAQTHLKLGEINRAIRDLNEALKRTHKSRHIIYLELGKIYLEQSKLSEAYHYFRKAIRSKQQQYGHDYAEAHYALVFYYLKTGDREQARRELETALNIHPNLEWDRHLAETLQVQLTPTREKEDVF